MKRFCSVLVCVVFCLPLVFIPTFADNVLETDSSSLRSYLSSASCVVSAPSSNPICSLDVDGVTVSSFSFADSVYSVELSVSCGLPHSISGLLYNNSDSSFVYCVFVVDNNRLSAIPDFPTRLSYSDSLSFSITSTASPRTSYFSIDNPIPEGSVPFTITAPGAFPSGAYLVSGVLNGELIFSYSASDAVRSVTLYLMPGNSYSFVGTFYNQSIYYMTLSSDGHFISTSSMSPSVLPYSDSYSLSFVGYNSERTNYFTIESPPFTNVISSGVGVVIDSFGDVIDYVVNTPSVAVFVALSVSCALIPLGIVAVKKVIKGY